MKGKIMAVAAVLVMVFAAVGVVMPQAGDADATTVTDLGYMTVANNTPASKTLATTEGQFTGYAYTLSVYMAEVGSATDIAGIQYGDAKYTMTMGSDGTVTAAFSGTEFTKTSQFTLAMARDGTQVGGYKLTATYVGAMTVAVPMAIKIAIIPTVYDETTGEQDLYYLVTITQNGASVGGALYINSMSFTGGTYGAQQIEASLTETSTGSGYDSNAKMTAGNYSWYAYNLPAGLSMSATGYVSGIYTGTDAVTDQEVTVVAVDNDSGLYYSGTMKISATASSKTGFSLKVYSGENTSGTEIGDGSSIVVKTGDEQKVNVSATWESPTSGGGSVLTSYALYAVGTDGKVTTLDASNNTYTLGTNGSGSYRIIATATGTVSGSSTSAENATYEETVSFYLYVMPVFENISAHISVSAS